MFFLFLLALDEVQGTIAAAEGEAITLNLKVLGVEDLEKIRVNGEKPKDWTCEAKGEKVVIEAPDLTVVLTVAKPSRRTCVIREDKDLVAITSEWAEGNWTVDAGKGDYKISTADDKLTVNGVELASLPALASAKQSSFHLVKIGAVQPWIGVAQKYFQSILDDDWKTFVSCYNKHDREMADRYASVQLHWKAGRRLVEVHKLKAYAFDHVDERFTKETQRKVYFRRMNEKGEQVGLPLPLTLIVEDGAWVVYLASQ